MQCRMDRQLMASEDLDKVRLLLWQKEGNQVQVIKLFTTYSLQIILGGLQTRQLGYSEEAKVERAVEYDKSKEKEGFVAGKHIDGRIKWWFQR